MNTIAVNIAGGPRAGESGKERQKSMAPMIALAPRCDTDTCLFLRRTLMTKEKEVCGFVSRPGFIGKDHDKALQNAEAMAWHGLPH
eukprot:3197464-Pyramimonas_sp.AAC.1